MGSLPHDKAELLIVSLERQKVDEEILKEKSIVNEVSGLLLHNTQCLFTMIFT